jgi:polyhydroxyalkanoate synthesis regulator phasin
MENGILNPDPWQQWQAFAARFTPPSPGSGAPGSAASASFAPFIDSAERFMVAARAYLVGASQASPGTPAEAARSFTDSIRELFADFPQPWTSSFGLNPVSSAPPAARESPALGAGREHQQRWQRMTDAWRRLEDAQRRLQRHWSDVLREAAAAFALKLGSASSSQASPQTAAKLYDIWIDCAEDAYARAAHSESFCDALAECVNAGSEWRKDMQASIEHAAKLSDLPTRSEMNALTERIRSLEAELGALRAKGNPTLVKPKTARRRPKS